MFKETTLRTIIKTIIFKLVTTSITACVMGISGAIKLHIVLTLFYLVYEKVWNRVEWGKIKII